MKLDQLGGKEIDGWGQVILFALAVVHTGYNAWILPGTYNETFRLCYEHPRGTIPLPPINYRLQFHASNDGFTSPLWCINIAAGIKFSQEGRP